MHGEKRSTRPGIPGPPPSSEELEARRRRDRLETLPDVDGCLAGDLADPHAPEPLKPKSVSSPLSSAPPPAPPRTSELPTVPGGGANRISDGREAAFAYIGVKTVSPGTSPKETRSAVKLDSTLVEENSRFQTEPSLLRRSLSPPADEAEVLGFVPRGQRKGRRIERYAILAVVAILALLVGALAVVVAGGRPHAPSDRIVWDNGIDGQPGYLDQPSALQEAKEGRATPTRSIAPLPLSTGTSPNGARISPLVETEARALTSEASLEGESEHGAPSVVPRPVGESSAVSSGRGAPTSTQATEGRVPVLPSAAGPAAQSSADEAEPRKADPHSSGSLTATTEERPNPPAEKPSPLPGAMESKQPWLE